MSRLGAVPCSGCSGRSGSAGWSFSAGARRRCVLPLLVTWVLVSCVRAWPHSMEGIQMRCSCVCWRDLQRTTSTMASWRPLPWVARSRRALTVSLVQLCCRRYQPRGVSRALPWRAACRRLGSLIAVGVRGGALGPGGSDGVGCRGLARLRRWVCGPRRAWLVWVVSGGLVADRRVVPGCHRCLWCGGQVVGVLLGRTGDVLEPCGRGWGACVGC